MAESQPLQVPCEDFLEFQDALRRLRVIDDKIVYALNVTIPTDSFKAQVDTTGQCQQLYNELQDVHNQREKAITKCITQVSNEIRQLSEKRAQDEQNTSLQKALRRQQTKLRLMQSEVNVEEVVKDRTLKIFYERCKSTYKPSSFKY